MQTFNKHHSKGWGGRVSDVHLTENCALHSKLLPGDVILADCGFTIDQAALCRSQDTSFY